mgnify:CR=1 FL=1
MSKKTVKDIDLRGKKVFVRCDFNVPMDENQNITDNRRIVAALPTIKYLIEQNCKIILASHLGRPKGEFKPEFSLAPVAKELSRLLGQEVLMAKDGQEVINIISADPKRIAALLLDLNMPNVDGFGVLDYLKENNLFTVVPTSIISGASDKESIEKAFKYPIVDMLNKPFSRDNVKLVVEKTVGISSM